MSEVLSDHVRKFNRLLGETDEVYHKAEKKLGLSESAAKILYAVYGNGGKCPLKEVILQSGISKQTINSALRGLESGGVIFLENADGKSKIVCLTESGRKLAENTVSRIIKAENEIFASWSEEERAAYMTLTRKYLKQFKEKLKEI